MVKSFLIIDDEKRLAKSYELFIKSRYGDVHIVHALNGEEGLEEARKLDYPVILTDVKMPVMDGIEFHKKLKEDHPDRAKKVIFISGNFHESHLSYIVKEKCPRLAKPFEVEEFYKLIDCLL